MLVIEEKKYFGAAIDSELKEKIDSQCSQYHWKVGRIVEALAELWAALPTEMQSRLYSRTESVTLENMIQEMVKTQVGAFLAGLNPAQQEQLDKDIRASKHKLDRTK